MCVRRLEIQELLHAASPNGGIKEGGMSSITKLSSGSIGSIGFFK